MINKTNRLVNPAGEMLKNLRKSLDMSQPKFAKEFGVARDTISQYEMGRRQVRLSLEQFLTLLRLLRSAKESGKILDPIIEEYLDKIAEQVEPIVNQDYD